MSFNNISPEATQAGESVKEAQRIADGFQSELTNNNDLVLQMRGKKQTYLTEMEMLSAKENLSLDLRRRQIELEAQTEAVSKNIESMTKDQPNIQHRIDVSTLNLNSARETYQKLIRPAIGGGNLSDFDINHLKQQKPRSQQTHSEKIALVDKYGMAAYTEHVPMI